MAGQIERVVFIGNNITEDEGGRPHCFYSFPDIERAREDLQIVLKDFRLRHDLRAIVGILGGADDLGTGQKQLVREFLSGLGDFKVGILSGGTQGGLPQIAVEEAHLFSLPTIGVFPQKRRGIALLNMLDLTIETPAPLVGDADFGTETPTLVGIPDAVVVIGGGVGTLTEVATILKRNKSLIKKGKTPVYLIPIYGSGGVADYVSVLPGIEDTESSFPPNLVDSGSEAAIFLKNKFLRS